MDEETKEVIDTQTEVESEEEFDYGNELKRLEEKKESIYSPLEKATYSGKKIIEEIVKLGGNPEEILGSFGKKNDDDDGGFKLESMEDLTNVIEKIVDGKVGNAKSEFEQAEVDTRVSKLAKDEEEQKVIKHVFNNVIQKTGDLNEDIENAYIIANKHRTKQVFETLFKKKENEKDVSNNGGGSQKRNESTSSAKPNSKEAEFAKSRGLVWSDDDKSFVSPARKVYLDKRKN